MRFNVQDGKHTQRICMNNFYQTKLSPLSISILYYSILDNQARARVTMVATPTAFLHLQTQLQKATQEQAQITVKPRDLHPPIY